MSFQAEIPYGAYWSTPFSKWQGSFADLHAIEFVAYVTKQELAKRNIPGEVFDFAVLGITVPQKRCFYGTPWYMSMAGMPDISGPMLGQACATGVRSLLAGAQEIEVGMSQTALVAACERISNGPNIYYPDPRGPGGTGVNENWNMDNMGCDPAGGHSMTQTGENVAKKFQITTEHQNEVALRREEQYLMATADDQAFQKKYMTLPFEVPNKRFKKTVGALEGDEGVQHSTPEGLAKLRPVLEGGTITFGTQTHPADGNAAIVLTTPERAKELSSDPNIRINIRGFGLARVELAYMPEAPVPAARKALEAAGITIDQIGAVKTHNPFAVNDIVFATETGYDLNEMNNYGSSLVWGHTQAPMALRALIELIEELVIKGGGFGLFTGCAAGDSSMAVVIEVSGG